MPKAARAVCEDSSTSPAGIEMRLSDLAMILEGIDLASAGIAHDGVAHEANAALRGVRRLTFSFPENFSVQAEPKRHVRCFIMYGTRKSISCRSTGGLSATYS